MVSVSTSDATLLKCGIFDLHKSGHRSVGSKQIPIRSLPFPHLFLFLCFLASFPITCPTSPAASRKRLSLRSSPASPAISHPWASSASHGCVAFRHTSFNVARKFLCPKFTGLSCGAGIGQSRGGILQPLPVPDFCLLTLLGARNSSRSDSESQGAFTPSILILQ